MQLFQQTNYSTDFTIILYSEIFFRIYFSRILHFYYSKKLKRLLLIDWISNQPMKYAHWPVPGQSYTLSGPMLLFRKRNDYCEKCILIRERKLTYHSDQVLGNFILTTVELSHNEH